MVVHDGELLASRRGEPETVRLSGVRPATGRVQLNQDHREYLILTVTPSKLGEVIVEGLDVTYLRDLGHLFQRGTEVVGIETRLRITR